MSDTDELRGVLADATTLRGDVRVRGTATRSVRARAKRRRAAAVGSGAVAVLLCVVVGLLAVTGFGGGGPTAVPASPATSGPAPSPPVLPQVAGGPHVLASPIVIRPVRTEYLNCDVAPATAVTVPAVYGSACYRLGAPWLVAEQLDRIEVTPASDPDGLVSEENGELVLTMTAADRATFGNRTADSIGRQVALVVGDRVWLAPTIGSPIEGGQLSLDLPVARLRALLDALGVDTGTDVG